MSPETEKVLEMVKIIIESTDFQFDQTRVGRVIKVLSNNRYSVQITDREYTIKSYFKYDVGERVFVLFPCGNNKDLYIYPNRINGQA